MQVNSRAPPALRSASMDAEVLARGAGVTDLELHGLADLHRRADGDAVAFGVETEHAADQEVAATELDETLVDDEPGVQTPRRQRPGLLVEPTDELAQPIRSRAAAELEHDVAIGRGDDERLADRATPLGHQRLDRAGRHDHADGAVGMDGPVEHEAVAARRSRRRCQAADDGQVRQHAGAARATARRSGTRTGR